MGTLIQNAAKTTTQRLRPECDAEPEEMAKACARRLRREREVDREMVGIWGFQRGRLWAAHEATEAQLDGLSSWRCDTEGEYGEHGEIVDIIADSKDPAIIEQVGRAAGLVNLPDAEGELWEFFGEFADDQEYVSSFVDAALVVYLDAIDVLAGLKTT